MRKIPPTPLLSGHHKNHYNTSPFRSSPTPKALMTPQPPIPAVACGWASTGVVTLVLMSSCRAGMPCKPEEGTTPVLPKGREDSPPATRMLHTSLILHHAKHLFCHESLRRCSSDFRQLGYNLRVGYSQTFPGSVMPGLKRLPDPQICVVTSSNTSQSNFAM